MPVRLHDIVIDAHDLPALARFWTQALGWKILSEREREIATGPDDNAPVGICFMPVTDTTTSGFPSPEREIRPERPGPGDSRLARRLARPPQPVEGYLDR